MTFKALQYLLTSTQAYTPANGTQLVLPPNVIADLATQLAGGYYTSVSAFDGVNYEIINITGVTSGAADVQRAQEGTTAVPLAQGAVIQFIWTQEGIQAVSPAGAVTLTGSGGSTVTGGPAYDVSSPLWTFTDGGGIAISYGATPYDVILAQSSVGTPFTVTGTGVANVTGGPYNFNVDVQGVILTAGTGITVTGTYPNFTINCTVVGGGSGTVTNLVAGPGITISGGSPTVNPTVGLTAVGPGAGSYGGITLNGYGQVTGFTGSLITSVVTSTSGLTIGGPTAGVLTLNIMPATATQSGITAFAPATSAGSNDASNNAQAVTPAGINAVVASLSLIAATFSVNGNQNASSPSAYTNTISGFSVPVTVAAGKFALIDLYVESYDPVNPNVVQNFGIALFNSSTLIVGVSSTAAGIKRLQCIIPGPFPSTLLSVKTTPLTGTQVIGSYSASVINN